MRRLYTAGAMPRQRVVIPHRGWGFFHRILTLQKKRKKKIKDTPDNICNGLVTHTQALIPQG